MNCKFQLQTCPGTPNLQVLSEDFGMAQTAYVTLTHSTLSDEVHHFCEAWAAGG